MKLAETTTCPICETILTRYITILENPIPGYSARLDEYYDCVQCEMTFLDKSKCIEWIKDIWRRKNSIPSYYWSRWMKREEIPIFKKGVKREKI
jgi:hypothetical protein